MYRNTPLGGRVGGAVVMEGMQGREGMGRKMGLERRKKDGR